MFDVLAAVRAVHFASTAMVVGGVLFGAFIGRPGSSADAACLPPGAKAYERQVDRTVWIGLIISIASGLLWLVFLAKDIAAQPWQDLFPNDTVYVVVTATQFGQVWAARLVMALLVGLAVRLGGTSAATRYGWPATGSVAVMAALLMGSLAWSGHAGGTPGWMGVIHRGSDFLHLVAAGAWLGGLLPLVLILRCARATLDPALANAAKTATLRFSRLGSISVGTLLVTGAVNTWSLAGNVEALVGTPYGELLLVKVGLFVVMVGIAAVNRLRLSPMLPEAGAMRSLQRNALIEFILGLIIMAIVGALGTLPPAVHEEMHLHAH